MSDTVPDVIRPEKAKLLPVLVTITDESIVTDVVPVVRAERKLAFVAGATPGD